MTAGAAVLVAMAAFAVPLAFGTSASAQPGDATTTTVTTTESSTSTTAPSTSSTSSTTSTTTASAPVNDEGVVILGANGETIIAQRAVAAPAPDQALAETGSSSAALWFAGVASLVSGAFALTFQRRRHLSLYTLRSSKRP
ncbi:MAG TPA: hypothetical protein VL769_11760 [Acidimicrobiia bacterium]|nr:hypothetical protein [Acidimicrobiia bacterium]